MYVHSQQCKSLYQMKIRFFTVGNSFINIPVPEKSDINTNEMEYVRRKLQGSW